MLSQGVWIFVSILALSGASRQLSQRESLYEESEHEFFA